MNQQSEHLSSAQIEDYGVHASSAESDKDIAVEKHLADCPSCRNLVLDFQRRQLGLTTANLGMSSASDPGLLEREAAGPDRLDSGTSGLPSGLQDASGDKRPGGGGLRTSPMVKTTATPDCLSEEDIRKQAAGLSAEGVASQRMRHVTTCNRCATLLKTYVEVFSEDFSPEERALLDQLKSASPEWQRQAARETLQDTAPAPAWVFFWKWAGMPAAACVGIVLIFWFTRPPTPGKVEALLAQAYTQQRTLEMRWPGAQWAALSITMGSNHTSTPRSLTKAEEALSKLPVAELRQDKWTRAIAEKDIAVGNPDDAVTRLNSAVSSGAAPVELQMDLAIAYFAKGKQTYDLQWYQKSRVVLDEILRQEPGNPVALFNRALINEELKALDQSEADWVKFLGTETDASWREEGTKHLKDVRELLGK